MKKLLVLVLVVVLVMATFVACAKPAEVVVEEPAAAEEPAAEEVVEEVVEEAMYADGVYFAQEDAFGGSGWRYFVIVTVDGGKIVDAQWRGTHQVPQGDKREQSEAGTYGMVKFGSAASFWYEQADAAIAWLLESQDPTEFEAFYTDEDGHTDALTTDGGAAVSVHVVEFFELVEKALANPAVPAGAYMDAVAVNHAELPLDDHGWIYKGDFVVANGTIVFANVNPLFGNEYVEGGDDAANFKVDDEGEATALSKKEIGDDYNMVAFGDAQAEWYEQAATMEAFILENQALEVTLDEEGVTDAVTGVSIHISEFVELFNMALK